MTTHNVPETANSHRPAALYDLEPAAMVHQAAQIATALASVIEKQKLFTVIQGKKHVRVDGWSTLGMMLGFLPREVEVKEMENGDYEATVELYNVKNGQIVGRASALCGKDERRWSSADRYARRSMATTRATGKAYRLGFAWILALAGYESTPLEEMVEPQGATKEPTKSGFDLSNQVHVEQLRVTLEKRGIPTEYWDKIVLNMAGKTGHDLEAVIKGAL